MSSESVLILAAGRLPDRQLGPAPLLHDHPLDLPAGSDLALQRLIKHYRDHRPNARLIAVIDQRESWQFQCLASQLDQILLIKPQKNVCETLKQALLQMPSLAERVIVNPITVLPTKHGLAHCCVVLNEDPLPRENWSAFKSLDPSSKSDLLSKLESPTTNEQASHAVTGLICGQGKQLLDALKSLDEKQSSDLGWLAWRMIDHHNAIVIPSPWHDLGHRATYARSRRSNLISRGHNEVSYDPKGDLINKRSSDHKRLAAEAAYLQELMPRLQRHFPALICTDANAGLKLDYLPYPSLSELFLHWQPGISGWTGIWKRLCLILDELQTSAPPVLGNPSWLYEGKLQHRLQQLIIHPPSNQWKYFWHQPLKLNEKNLPSPEQCCLQLLQSLPSLQQHQPLMRIHGDLCFNNILADPLHGTVRLIDPRGEAAPDNDIPVGFGDPRYELVKLLHSGVYLYDLVVHDLFTLKAINNNNSWSVQMHPPRQFKSIAAQIRTITRQRGLTAEEEQWLTASLFFSMLPLHSDSLQRQQMLCLIGCCIVQGCFSLLLP